MIALAWQLGPHVHEIAGLPVKNIMPVDGKPPAYFIRINCVKSNKQH
jgi:hypothetical protein